MNKLSIVKEKFDIIEPIFDYELYDLGFSDKDISDTLEENVFEELFGVDIIPCRIFYLVSYSKEFDLYGRLNKDSNSITLKYFIGNKFEYGYLDGFCSLNFLKLSNQVCFSYNIKSVRADKVLKYSKFNISPIKECDYLLIMCVNAFKYFSDYFDCSYNDAIIKVRNILSGSQFDLFKKEINK